MREITQQPQTLQVISCENFHKRQSGLERFIPKAYLRETYMVLVTWMNEKTRICWPGVREVAARSGTSRATIQRHISQLERLGVVQRRMRRKSCRSNLTNVYFLPLLNEDFLRSRVMPPPPQNEAVVLIPEIKEQTTTARVARARWKPDRETYKPRPNRMTFREAWSLKCAARASLGTWRPDDPNDPYELARIERERMEEEARQWRELRGVR